MDGNHEDKKYGYNCKKCSRFILLGKAIDVAIYTNFFVIVSLILYDIIYLNPVIQIKFFQNILLLDLTYNG